MRIAVVSTYYSEDMGYTENCLPRALAALGHEVHVVTSNWNIYGDGSEYHDTYRAFLGPADQGTGTFSSDGYTVHRLPSRIVGGCVLIRRLGAKLRALSPAIVHSLEIASLQTFQLAALRPVSGFRLFAETHQHLSVVRPYMRDPGGSLLRRAMYRATRTLPTYLASFAVEKCYAISPDCVYVARTFYGVPEEKLKLQPLGTDTTLFRPAATQEECARRAERRHALGYGPDDIVCVYTGRFSEAKNPLVLARAVEALSRTNARFHALFIGQGPQRDAMASCGHTRIIPFMKHRELADYYRLADVAVWPREESVSMLDAAAAGLPVVASATMGEPERVSGNGRTYLENNMEDLITALASLASDDERRALGAAGRSKMIRQFSWHAIARSIVADYETTGRRG